MPEKGNRVIQKFRFDVTDILRPNDNDLVVEIANTWSNRLVGDAIKGEHFTSTNIYYI